MSDSEAPAQEETKRKRGRPSKAGGEVKVRVLAISVWFRWLSSCGCTVTLRCLRRNLQYFGKMFLRLIYINSWTVMEMMVWEKCGLFLVLHTWLTWCCVTTLCRSILKPTGKPRQYGGKWDVGTLGTVYETRAHFFFLMSLCHCSILCSNTSVHITGIKNSSWL
jgi:hypothetical protein